MSNLDKVLQYREQVDEAHRQVALSEGALQHAIKNLSADFNCDTVEDGEILLSRLQNKIKKLNKKISKKQRAFENKWKDQL
jgi:hypothetical protein